MDWHITRSFWKCTREAENVARGGNETKEPLKQEVPQELLAKKQRRKVENSKNSIKKDTLWDKKPSWLIPDRAIMWRWDRYTCFCYWSSTSNSIQDPQYYWPSCPPQPIHQRSRHPGWKKHSCPPNSFQGRHVMEFKI